MQARSKFPFLIAAIGVACLAVPLLVIKQITRHHEQQRLAMAPRDAIFPSTEMAKLDKLVQDRFAVIPRENFGMARVGPRHSLFQPVTPSEQSAVNNLRRANYDVVFFVAGQNYLRGRPTAGSYPASLQGPIYMTQKPPLVVAPNPDPRISAGKARRDDHLVFQSQQKPPDLPTEAQLNQSLVEMLKGSNRWDHTDTPNVKNYQAGSWKVVAVPVRASSQTCVQCHNYLSHYDPPRLGDPLGIALYAYRFPHPVVPPAKSAGTQAGNVALNGTVHS